MTSDEIRTAVAALLQQHQDLEEAREMLAAQQAEVRKIEAEGIVLGAQLKMTCRETVPESLNWRQKQEWEQLQTLPKHRMVVCDGRVVQISREDIIVYVAE